MHGNDLLGVKPKSLKGMATLPSIPAKHTTVKAIYEAQSKVR